MSENLIDKLKELGFNTYEAKVYLALLKHHPATGYEISKESGVPQARAYDTLKVLETTNVVVAIGGKPVTYMPVRPDELLDRWEKSFNHSIKYLRDALPTLVDEKVEPVINMRGEESIFKHALEMVATAKRSIYLELWQVDTERFRQPLLEAKNRGVDVRVVGYNGCHLDGINVYHHSEVDLMDGRWLILSMDDLEGMVSTTESGDRPPQAVVTRNPGIVLIIKELIVHDIFLIDVEQRLRPEIEQIYGKNMQMRRQKVFGVAAEVGMH